MGVFAISGCATGIGAAIRKRFESDGHRIIGIDLRVLRILRLLRILKLNNSFNKSLKR